MILILQNEFTSNGYINLLDGKNAINNGIDLEDLFDINDSPRELL